MSLSLLLEKYDVSTEEGLQKALSEIEKEEAEVDEALSGALSRACTLEGRLRTASQAYTKLGEVKADAQDAANMVDRTAALAKDVSAKVRQLDLARSRVAECQRRVHDLIDLQLCSAGVEAAIKAHDYETGAGHVARFLSMDPGSVAAARARGAPDPRDAMTRAATTLREHLVRKFEEAARKDDAASVERLFKLFPQIGRAEEGVDLLAKYLAAQTEVAIRRACVVSDPNSEAAVFADAMTRVLECAAAAVERCRAAAAASAPALLPRAVRIIQPTVCAGARRVSRELVARRRVEPEQPARAPLSPLAAEPALVELSRAHNTVVLYFTFLRRKAEADAATVDEATRKASIEAMDKIIAECDLTRTAQDLLGHYLALERYFLEENVNKALKMATPQTGVTTSSLVDDIFFIARKAIRRSVATGSVQGACAVLNDAGALVERGAGALRRWLRAPPDVLPLPPPPSSHAMTSAAAVLDAAGALATRLNRDVDAQRDLFLAHTNEAEAGGEWSERLAAEACAEAEVLVRAPADRDRLLSCAAGLAAAAAAYRAAHDLALDGIKAALKPRVVAWAEYIADPGCEPDEMEEDADALPIALDTLLEGARAALSPRATDAVLLALLADLAARAEARLLHHHYTREGGLVVERRARRLAAWAGGAAAGARERLARLTQAAALLALERLAHVSDVVGPATRLAPNLIRDILARRTDFKIEDIKRLKF
ncbi:conserved oligomeric Golgi complex subunit 4 [Ostrinia furnacalis]|uniref:conserved oligomeric Golgi complex subunit 4 n=1 Tax=Ostrinia furnacalis TaxID=93504 RepID=UPI00103AF95A|nr:conserved oligomeric Golgi complex subunit 4 [Ostrinia furnacalis]